MPVRVAVEALMVVRFAVQGPDGMSWTCNVKCPKCMAPITVTFTPVGEQLRGVYLIHPTDHSSVCSHYSSSKRER